jgi:hypothetical protein
VTDIDIRRFMFVFDWFLANIVDPNFAWANFTHALYVADKRSRAVAKEAKTTSVVPSTSTAPVSSTIDLSTNVLTADAKRQSTPVTPGTTATLKLHLLWNSPFAASSRNPPNICQLHNTDIVLASLSPLDVLELYRKLVAAAKHAEVDLVPILAFYPDHAPWPHNRCADIIFKINDALALHLDQTGTLNLDNEMLHILYQKHILDSSRGVLVYAFLHALLKKAKHQLSDKMPTPPDIEKATSIRSFGANLERYYLQLQTMGVSFDDKTKSHFFLSALQQKYIEVDRFADCLDNVPDADPLPDELTLTELILWIKDIHSFHNSSTAIINRYVRPTNDNELSNTRQNHQSSSSDSRPNCPSLSDLHPTRTRSDTQCMCGRWGHSVENCQQLVMHLLIAKYLQKYANMASAGQISESWQLTNEQHSQSA